MKPGPKPLPPHVKAARGTAQPCRDTYRPLETPEGAVTPPPGMPLEALVIWDDLAPVAIALGTLKPADAYAFAQLCNMTAAIQSTWRGGPPAPAAYVAQWRLMLELFGLAGAKSRLVTEATAKHDNPFLRNGRPATA